MGRGSFNVRLVSTFFFGLPYYPFILSCKQFVPIGSKWKDAKAKTTFGRKSAISIVASFNQTDWVSGWNHFIQGCTIFINPEFEKTLDPDDSVILSPGTLPILSVEQIKTKKLGSPYSKCIERNRIESSLSPFSLLAVYIFSLRWRGQKFIIEFFNIKLDKI